jgi:hypothetical protein
MTHTEALQQFAELYHSPHLLPTCIADQGASGVEVYRNNSRANRSQALEAAYPTIYALLGAEGFTTLARRYVAHTPSPAADLHRDGSSLPDFISSLPELADLPWLGDSARLDWALHHSHRADAHPALSAVQLAHYDTAGLAGLRLGLGPQVALIESWWPIGDILTFHHGGPPPDDSAGAQSILVWRDRWQRIGMDDAACLRGLMTGKTLGQALLDGEAQNPGFDPQALLSILLTYSLLVNEPGDNA